MEVSRRVPLFLIFLEPLLDFASEVEMGFLGIFLYVDWWIETHQPHTNQHVFIVFKIHTHTSIIQHETQCMEFVVTFTQCLVEISKKLWLALFVNDNQPNKIINRINSRLNTVLTPLGLSVDYGCSLVGL